MSLLPFFDILRNLKLKIWSSSSYLEYTLEGTSDIIVTPKLGVASILRFNFKIAVLGAGQRRLCMTLYAYR